MAVNPFQMKPAGGIGETAAPASGASGLIQGLATAAKTPFQLGGGLPLQGSPGAGASEKTYSGPLHSHVPGRTDRINAHVKPGAYVIPADVTSIVGEGNTLAGTQVFKKMFSGKALTGSVKPPVSRGRYRSPLMQARRTRRNMGLSMHADGGPVHKPIPVVVAGGEHIVDPEEIVHKFGDLNHGHECLDAFVKAVRQKEIERLKNAPPPKK